MKQKLTITKGQTFSQVVRWETEPFLFTAILGMSNTAPVRITTGTHGLQAGWRVAVVDAGGMTELNAANNPPKIADLRRVTVFDTTHIDFNPTSSVGYGTWTSGGYLQWYTPKDLTSYTAILEVKDKVGGTVLLSLTTENAGIAINVSTKTITLAITAAASAALTWVNGVYDLKLILSGVVTQLLHGPVTVTSTTKIGSDIYVVTA